MNTEQRPFGFKDKIAYMCGDIANDLTFIMSAFFLMLFYTNVLEIPGYIVGILFLCSRFIDAFTDIGMGKLIDTMTPAKDGRFRCWIRRIAPFVCISGFLLFLHVVKDFPYEFKLVYITVTYIIWGSFFYTAINIPYGSMAAVISHKPEERASLSVFRSVGANIAVMFISFFVPLVVYQNIDGKQIIIPERFTIVAGVFVIVAFVLYRICYKYTIERIQIPTKEHKRENCLSDIKDIFSSLSCNKALMILIIAAIILLLANLLIGTMNPYLYIDYFNSKLGLS
ncbi:MFS transporter, partial [Testudinibacter sp. TR-2022]